MAEVSRCQEAIASFVLDAGQAVSHRALASHVGGASATRTQALAQFLEANDAVHALHVTVVKEATKSKDPRARVIRVTTSAPAAASDASVYGVFPGESTGTDDASVRETVALALWAHERKVRNDLFVGMSRHQPLSRELKAFYDSEVQCVEATSRTDMTGSRGEEAVSMFDAMSKSTASARSSQSAAKSSNSSFFKGSSNNTTSTSTTSSKTSSSSFFKSGTNGASTSAKPKAAATSAPAAKSSEPATKRIDANAMNNVLSVDSDSDEDDDDGGAPAFVKTTPTPKARTTKRVMISDDDEEEDFDAPAPRTTTKRKQNESPERPTKQAKPSSPKTIESPKRKHEEEEPVVQDDEPQAEEDPLPSGPIKRRKLVSKTVIKDGYMVTENVYEDVEVSAEEVAKERAEAKKKAAAAKAAADAQKARAAAAATNGGKAKAAGPAKQKKLDFFFTRK